MNQNDQPAPRAPNIREMIAVSSSQLAAIGHDPDTNTLAIRFNGKGDKPGSLYHYDNFTAYQFAELTSAESKGSYFIRNVKNNPAHPYRRVEEKPADAGPGENPGAA